MTIDIEMRLSALDAAIVAHYPLLAETPVESIARMLGVAAHRVRYAIQRLIDAEVFVSSSLIDISKLGLHRYTVFVAVSFGESRARERFEKRVLADSSVAFAARLAGRFDYELGIVSQSELAAHDKLATLFEGEHVRLGPRIVLRRLKSILMQRKYMSRKRAVETRTVFDARSERVHIDEKDESILRLLAAEPEASRRDLSRAIGMSLPAVQHRVERLRASKVYNGPVMLTRFERYGALFFSLLVSGRQIGSRFDEAIATFAAECPHATHLVSSVGEWDFELGLEVATHDELRRVQDALERELGSMIREQQVVPRINTMKFVPYPSVTTR